MHFYIDESGHTGLHLFDRNQPMLYYGVLSSPCSVDHLGISFVEDACRKLGVERLHANDLGNNGISEIGHDLFKLQKRLDLRFDLFRVAKADHAVICFFDQVFDQGVNPAVPWTGYWTPLRYILLFKIAYLFDEELAERAWKARTDLNRDRANASLVEICSSLLARVNALPDARSREVISDALTWARENPEEIIYSVIDKDHLKQVSPNLVGFQLVLKGISSRCKKRKQIAQRIVADRQSEFNKSQETLIQLYQRIKGEVLEMGPGLPELDLKGLPSLNMEFSASADSAGLQIVDLYLWNFKRLLEGKEICAEIMPTLKQQMLRGITDEVSLHALAHRWGAVFASLPEPEEGQLSFVEEFMRQQEERRQFAMKRSREEIS